MIVVLDSGIWISALQFDGTTVRALERALAIDQVAYWEEIRIEIVRVLTEKLGRRRER